LYEEYCLKSSSNNPVRNKIIVSGSSLLVKYHCILHQNLILFIVLLIHKSINSLLFCQNITTSKKGSMKVTTKSSLSSHFAIVLMLFASFFGARILIFPAELGQPSGTNLVPAIIVFFITGTGLPLLGVLAITYARGENLQELESKINPVYAIFFTSL